MKILQKEEQRKAYKLDKKDEKILAHYCRNVRLPLSTIAKLVGLSRQSVEHRLSQMEKAHLTVGSRTIVNVRKLGYFSYHVFIEIHGKEDRKKFIEKCVQSDVVNALISYIGKWDFEVSIMAKDPAEFQSYLSSLLEGIRIGSYSFGIIIDTVKAKVLPSLPPPPEYKGIRNDPSFTKSFNAKTEDYLPDKRDETILKLLAADARMRLTEVATHVKLTSDAVAQRIRKLIQGGYIKQFRAVVDYAVLGLSVQCILLSGQMPKEFEAFIRQESSVLWTAKTVGNWDYVIYVLSSSPEEFSKFANQIKEKFGQSINASELLFGSQDYKYTFMSKNVRVEN